MYMVYFHLIMALLEYFKKRTNYNTSTEELSKAVVFPDENGQLHREIPSSSIRGASEELDVAISLARS